MVQQVKDPVLSLQWLRSLLWHGFDSWPRDLYMLCVAKNKNLSSFIDFTVIKRREYFPHLVGEVFEMS